MPLIPRKLDLPIANSGRVLAPLLVAAVALGVRLYRLGEESVWIDEAIAFADQDPAPIASENRLEARNDVRVDGVVALPAAVENLDVGHDQEGPADSARIGAGDLDRQPRPRAGAGEEKLWDLQATAIQDAADGVRAGRVSPSRE